MNYMITVDDAGELKSVSAAEVSEHSPLTAEFLDGVLSEILDRRAIAAGEYEPEDDDLPIQVSINGVVR